MSPAAATCAEKTRLLRDHLLAKLEYMRAVTFLHEQSGTMFKRDYDAIRTFAEKTEESIEQARVALQRHSAEHGC
jgi:hypothetical protein